MTRTILLLSFALAACGDPQVHAKFWRKHKRVCVAIDGAKTLLDIRAAAMSGQTPNAADLTPHYAMINDRLVIWMNEDDVPPGTTYQYMTPYQAIHAAWGIDGPGGACIAKGNTCDSWLSGQDVHALDEELKKDGLPDEGFAVVRKPA